MNRRLGAVVIDADEGDVCGKDNFLVPRFDMAAEHVDMVRDGRSSNRLSLCLEAQHGLRVDAFLEFHFAHADRDEMKGREVFADRDPSDLVHPHQHFPAEEEPVVVHVARHYQFARRHCLTTLLCVDD